MTVWKFDDGTEVESGGDVAGDSDFALDLTDTLLSAKGGFPPMVQVTAPPAGGVALDPDNDWLLDRWLKDMAERHDLELTTKYDPEKDKPPAAAQELLDEIESPEWESTPDDAIF